MCCNLWQIYEHNSHYNHFSHQLFTVRSWEGWLLIRRNLSLSTPCLKETLKKVIPFWVWFYQNICEYSCGECFFFHFWQTDTKILVQWFLFVDHPEKVVPFNKLFWKMKSTLLSQVVFYYHRWSSVITGGLLHKLDCTFKINSQRRFIF